MTQARYNLLLELFQELNSNIEEIRDKVDNFDKYTSLSNTLDIDSSTIVLTGREPWQYGEDVTTYLNSDFVIDERKEAAFLKQEENRKYIQQRKLDEEKAAANKKTEKELETLRRLQEKYR